jgi:hypothetical protein
LPQQKTQILDLFLELDDAQADALPIKPVYEALSGVYSYEILRCVRAELIFSREMGLG